MHACHGMDTWQRTQSTAHVWQVQVSVYNTMVNGSKAAGQAQPHSSAMVQHVTYVET